MSQVRLFFWPGCAAQRTGDLMQILERSKTVEKTSEPVLGVLGNAALFVLSEV